jgi:hypothetical protein
MIDDPIVSEVRRHRATILESYGGNLRRYHDAVQQSQGNRFAGQLTTLPPRKKVEPVVSSDSSQSDVFEPSLKSSSVGSRR